MIASHETVKNIQVIHPELSDPEEAQGFADGVVTAVLGHEPDPMVWAGDTVYCECFRRGFQSEVPR